MRLREIQWILTAAIPHLKVAAGEARGAKDTQRYQTVTDLDFLREALQLVAHVAQFQQEASRALGSNVLAPHYNSVDALDHEVSGLRGIVNALNNRASTLLGVINQVLPEERSDTFSIHVPLKEELSIEAFQQELEDFRTIFDQPVRRLAGSSLVVAGVDSGCWVIEIAAVAGLSVTLAQPALKVVAKMYEAAKEFRLFQEKLKQEVEHTRSFQLDNRLKEAAVEIAEKKREIEMRRLAKELCDFSLTSDEENFSLVVAKNIKMLSEKLDQGVEVKLSSRVPKSIADAAPPEMLAPSAALKPIPEPELPKQLTEGTAEEDHDAGEGD